MDIYVNKISFISTLSLLFWLQSRFYHIHVSHL